MAKLQGQQHVDVNGVTNRDDKKDFTSGWVWSLL